MKKLKKILSFLLSLIIIFSTFPVSAYASEYHIKDYECTIFNNSIGNSYYPTVGDSISQNFCKYSDLNILGYFFYISNHIDKGDKVTVSLFPKNLYITNCDFFMFDSSFGDDLLKGDLEFNYSNNTFNLSFTAPFNCDDAYLNIEVFHIKSISSYANSYVDPSLSKIVVSTESESTGLLNSILEWLRNIRDNIADIPSKLASSFTELGSKITNSFTELGSKITNAFTNLKDQLTAAFASIANSFKTLGNDISNFFDGVKEWFSNLGDLLVEKFHDVTSMFANWLSKVISWFADLLQWLNDLFSIDKDYINQRFNDLKTTFISSLGGFAELMDFVLIMMNAIKANDSADELVLTLPSISFPCNGRTITLTPDIEFDYGQYLTIHPVFNTIYTLYQSFVSMLIVILLFSYTQKRFIDFIQSV